jgi:phosphohistidine phosphatase
MLSCPFHRLAIMPHHCAAQPMLQCYRYCAPNSPTQYHDPFYRHRGSMRRVMLLRHAKSDWSLAAGDRERPLNERGQDAAPKIGRYIAQAQTVPDLILCSTAQRTRQTCDLITASFSTVPKIVFEEELYLAEAGTIIGLIRATPDTIRRLMIIGHNPGIHQAAADLTGSGNAKDRATLSARFPTAALAVIDFANGGWADVLPHAGKLDRFITPRLLSGED